MKKVLYAILSAFLLMLSVVGCKEDNLIDVLPQAVPLTVTVDSKNLVMGDHLIMTFKVDGEGDTSNEDFDIYLTAKSGTEDKAQLFKGFPEMITFHKGEKEMQLDLLVSESGVSASHTIDIAAFVRGYRVTGAVNTVTVSDFYRTTIALKDNQDKEVKEGDSFILTAQVAVKAREEVVVKILPAAGEESIYENLPTTLIIPAGSTIVESEVITLKKDGVYKGDANLNLAVQTESTKHPLVAETFMIKMLDIDKPFGDKLQDERWVYGNPSIPFASTIRLSDVNAKYGEAVAIREGDAHPNAELAKEGWLFYNAQEFHLVGKTGDMWTYNTVNDTYVPAFLAAQNTATAQSSAGVDINKFSTITEAGYLKMFEMKIKTNATGGASGPREYGTAAFYANNQANAFKANHTPTLMGSRVEVRARVRGNKKGFNMAIWMLGNSDYPYGEIDLLENPASNDGDSRAFQTFHVGADAITSKGQSQMTNMNNISDWNIYWMEWIDENTVRIGLNGMVTTTLLNDGSVTAKENWAFNPVKNPKGLKLIITMGAPSKWALNGQGDTWVPPVDWDKGFASFTNYMQDRDNNAIPRLEIDWIRTYINMPKAQYEKLGVQKNGTKFY